MRHVQLQFNPALYFEIAYNAIHIAAFLDSSQIQESLRLALPLISAQVAQYAK